MIRGWALLTFVVGLLIAAYGVLVTGIIYDNSAGLALYLDILPGMAMIAGGATLTSLATIAFAVAGDTKPDQ